MSAFIVNNKTINRIVTYLVSFRDEFGKDNGIGKELLKFDKELNPQEIGKRMLELNCKSVSQRYNEPIDKRHINEYEYVVERTTLEQAIRHLHCLTYQSCEGKCDKPKKYKALEKIIQLLENHHSWKMCDIVGVEWEASENEETEEEQ